MKGAQVRTPVSREFILVRVDLICGASISVATGKIRKRETEIAKSASLDFCTAIGTPTSDIIGCGIAQTVLSGKR